MKTVDSFPELAICATMSAGKSTFLNALLGADYFPSSNMACTAKISSILNTNLNINPSADCLFSAKRMSNGQIVTNLANRTRLEEWNRDDSVKQIYLVGKFQNISTQFIAHDTPGTNNSLHLDHRNITYQFLSENPPNIIAFVINAENNGSNDEIEFLRQLKDRFDDKRGPKFIFIVNKMDSPDFEREDLHGFLQDTLNDLTNLGFEKPLIFPVSAHAALLFRMILNERSLNRKESRALVSYYDYFTTDGLNLTKTNSSVTEDAPNTSINFLGKNYSVASLYTAIRRTGICDFEEFLAAQFQKLKEDTSHLKFIPAAGQPNYKHRSR